jgi:ABC-type transporter Mla subunit MlaD
MSEPERDDFAVLSGKIENITRQLPKLREKVADSRASLDAAALVMERVLKIKQELLEQHHESVLKTPLTARARRRTSSVCSIGPVFGDDSTHPSPAMSATSSSNTSPNHAGHGSSVFDPECGVTLGDAIDQHVSQATMAQAVRTKETMDRLNQLTQQLKRTENKVQTAVAEWRKYVSVVSMVVAWCNKGDCFGFGLPCQMPLGAHHVNNGIGRTGTAQERAPVAADAVN